MPIKQWGTVSRQGNIPVHQPSCFYGSLSYLNLEFMPLHMANCQGKRSIQNEIFLKCIHKNCPVNHFFIQTGGLPRFFQRFFAHVRSLELPEAHVASRTTFRSGGYPVAALPAKPRSVRIKFGQIKSTSRALSRRFGGIRLTIRTDDQ